MKNYDLKNYDFGSDNALLLEQRIRNAGVWPDNPLLATKMLRRQLRILRAGDMADMVAFGSLVNDRDANKVRLRYWSDRAARLCQDQDIFDWPNKELTLDEIQGKLTASGIDCQTIEDDLQKIMEQANARRDRNIAKEERRQKRFLKEQKNIQLLKIKYKLLLSRVENEHGLKLEYSYLCSFPNKVCINWSPEAPDDMFAESYFSVYRVYPEDESSTAFPSTVNAIRQVKPICQALTLALQRNGNHLSLRNKKLMVMSGYGRRFYRHSFLLYPFDEDLHEEVVTEGEDVDLAARLSEQVEAVGLSLSVH